MQLESLGRPQFPFGAEWFCTLLHPQKIGKIVSDSQKRTKCRRQERVVTVSWQAVLTWSLSSPAASLSLAGCKLLAGDTQKLIRVLGNTLRVHLPVEKLGWHYDAYWAASKVICPQTQNT